MPSYTSIVAADADRSDTISNTAVTLTLPAYFTVSSGRVNHGRAVIQVRTAPILYTVNGTAPTAADESTGTKANIGDLIIITTLNEMRNFNAIRATGSDGAIFTYYQARTA